MSFDPVTYSSVMAIIEPVGAMKLVPSSFSNDKYVDTGSSFDPEVYPQLAAMYAAGVDPATVSTVEIPAIPQTLSKSNRALSTLLVTFEYDSRLYFVYASGAVFRSPQNDYTSMSYFRTLPLWYGLDYTFAIVANKTPSNAKAIMVNNFLYFGVHQQWMSLSVFASGTVVRMSAASIANPDSTSSNYQVVSGLTPTDISVASTVIESSGSGADFGNGKYVFIGYSTLQQDCICVSSDGITFSKLTRTNLGVTESTSYVLSGVKYGNSIWVLTTSSGTATVATNNVLTSPDASTWTRRSITIGVGGFTGLTFVGGATNKFASLCSTQSKIMTSTDGITWTNVTTPAVPSRIYENGNGDVIMRFSSSGSATQTIYRAVSPVTSFSATAENTPADVFQKMTGTAATYNFRYAVLQNGSTLFCSAEHANTSSLTSAIVNSTTQLEISTTFYCVTPNLLSTAPTIYDVDCVTAGNSTRVAPPVFLDNAQTGLCIESSGTDYSTIFVKKLNLLRTTDGGSTWTPAEIVLPYPVKLNGEIHTSGTNFFIFGYSHARVLPYTLTGVTGKIFTCVSMDGINWTFNESNSVTLDARPVLSVNKQNVICGSMPSRSVTTTNIISFTSIDLGVTFTERLIAVASGNGSSIVKSGKDTTLWWNATGTASGSDCQFSNDGGQSWSTAGFPRTFTSSTFGGMTETENIVFVYAILSNTAYVSYDKGSSWKSVQMPFTVGSQSNVSSIGEWIVVTTGAGSIMMTKDGDAWAYKEIPAQNRRFIISESAPTGAAYYGGGLFSFSTSQLLRVSSNANTVPPVSPLTAGSKWVVRAQK